MSLAGKILSVVATLMLLVCIWLTAQVAALESNNSKAVDLQAKSIETQTAELAELKVATYGVTQDLLAARNETDHALRLLRQGLEDLQTRLSQAEETHLRVELLKEAELSINITAAAAYERRVAELADYRDQKKQIDSELIVLASENDQLLARATELKDRFESVLAENQKLLQDLAGRPLPAYSQNPLPVVR